MSAGARLKSLLAVQKQRVDRAMAVVHERNGTLRQRELERHSALERWEAAVVAYRLERQRLTESIANPGGAPWPLRYPGGKADGRGAQVRRASGVGGGGGESACRC
jgi:hypothetical protein